MSTITIKSGKLSNGMFLNYSFEEKKEDSTDTVKKQSDLPIHEDCKKAFNKLIPHFILLSEQFKFSDEITETITTAIEKDEEIDIENEYSIFSKFKVDEFKIQGKADNEGIIISGKRYLSTGKTISIVTPFTKWDNDYYNNNGELIETAENLREEVYQYYKGKHAPLPKQESFDFDEDFEDEPIDSLKEIGEKLKKNLKDSGVTMEVVEKK